MRVGAGVIASVGHGVDHADHGVTHHQIADLVSAAHDGSHHRVGAVALVLHSLVQRRVEIVAFVAEARKAESLKGGRQLVGDRLQRSGLQIAVAARPVEIVENRQQLGDHGAFARSAASCWSRSDRLR